MPITQPRFLSLLSSTEDFRQALFQAEETVRRACQSVKNGLSTPEAELQTLELLVTAQGLLKAPMQSEGVLQTERAWFASRAKYNTRMKVKQEAKRNRQRPDRVRLEPLAEVRLSFKPDLTVTLPADHVGSAELPNNSDLLLSQSAAQTPEGRAELDRLVEEMLAAEGGRGGSPLEEPKE